MLKSLSKYFLIALFILTSGVLYAQDDNKIEINLIDSYIKQEAPHIFKLSFFAFEEVKAEIELNNKFKFTISDEFKEDHTFEKDVTDLGLDSAVVKYYITVENRDGVVSKSGPYDLVVPFYDHRIKTDKSLNIFTVCCLGGTFFGIPSPTGYFRDGEEHWAFSKELPLISYYQNGYNYPDHYLSIEYTYVHDLKYKHYFRLGYKYILELPVIEYASAGVTGFTDFGGFNGVGTEATLGFFKFYNIFTFYGRYRYNFQPSEFDNNFQEVSFGLYSNFFSLNF